MGEVYKAEDTRLGRFVALKFLRSDVSRDVHALERFRVEARAASALNHPNICTIYEIGESDGRTFIAMELLEGRTLRQQLRAKPLEAKRLLNLATQIADGLEAAHSRGIIHRDIKPENLFVVAQDRVKILDFGLAKLQPILGSPADAAGQTATTRTAQAPLTMPGVVAGTPAYMSPEQIRGDDLDSRSDLFSLGAVLFEMAAGRPAFEGRSHADIAAAVLGQPPGLPAAVDPRLRAALQEIVNKALEKTPELRYQHASDLAADLKRLMRDLDVDRPRVPVALSPAFGPPTTSLRGQLGGDLLKAAALAALVFGAHDLFAARPSGRYLDDFQIAFVQDNVKHGPLDNADFEAGGRHLPLVVDIAALHSDKKQRTDRKMLDTLIDELRRHNARAIGLDLIFDDLQGEDFQYLQKWAGYANVRVGIYGRALEQRAAWLGRSEFAELAAGIALPLEDPQRAYFYSRRWFLKTQLDDGDAPDPAACVGASSDARCKEDLIQLPAAMWLISERQRIASERLGTSGTLEARLKDSLQALESRSAPRALGEAVELGEYAIDYSYLKGLRQDIVKLPPASDGGSWEAAIAGLAAVKSRIADRVVLVGDLEDTTDYSCPTAGLRPVSGVLIHACSLATLNRGMVFRITETLGWTTLLAAALFLIGTIVGLRVFYFRSRPLQQWPFQYVEVLSFGSLSMLVFTGFIWHARARGIVWPNYLWVCGALLAHPFVSEPLCRTVAATRGVVRATASTIAGRTRRG